MEREGAGMNLVHRLPDWRATLARAQATPRCGACSKRTGLSCQAPAMSNGRCRMHGGASTGPRTAEGLARIAAAHTKRGLYGAEMREVRRRAAEKRARTGDGLPTLAEARRRLVAWKTKPSPFLTPEALDRGRDLPELMGPSTYRKPRRTP